MKKIISIILVLLLSGCSKNTINKIANELDTNLDKCSIVKESDTHGGFLGDGEYFVKMNCSSIKINNNWQELPLPDEIDEVLTMKWCDNKDCKDFYHKYNIKDLKVGFYYFIDRHSESKNKNDYKDINNRSSYNFTIAIYNKINEELYYYEIDT